MRRSAFFCQTLRESPADVETAGQRLLLRGGYVQPLAAGIYSFLPMEVKVSKLAAAVGAPDLRPANDTLYQQLTAAGITVLYDDRAESAGVKFADADLLGMPLRLRVGRRSVQRGAVEVKRRSAGESLDLPLATAPADSGAVLDQMAGLDGASE